MKYFTVIILGTASLIVAAPAAQSPANSGLEKRRDPNANCGLEMYGPLGQRALLHQLYWLTDRPGRISKEKPQTLIGYPGKSTRVSCWGKTGIFLNIDPKDDDLPVGFPSADIAWKVDYLYHECFQAAPADEDAGNPAMQLWQKGFNIVVQGNQFDKDCGGN